ncbi:hypothetical protein [Pseudorhodoferax sp.]|uniref:hypothetical protein n=1 Tax=Pseudorhodoferax sp. TaxID=1993553 RepID=UPI0039E55CE6
MRADQISKLEELAVDLMDVFLNEADPSNWTGAGQAQVKMTKETRGARNWDMKNANQAGALTARAMDLLERVRGVRRPLEGDDSPEADIAKFEREAKRVLEGMGVRG